MRLGFFFFFAAVACSRGGGDEDGVAESELSCTPFTKGMVVTHDTTLCAGREQVALAAGEAAIVVAADHVRLACDAASAVSGTSASGTGIRIGAHVGVTVEGCTLHGLRYGLVARGARDLRLDGVHLDDNFTDPSQEWVQDGVQGGGVRLEDVRGALVTGATFGGNWNGIEVRRSKDVRITKSHGDHCSNWGAFVDRSDDTEISDSSFDWGIRWGRARAVADIPLEQRTRANWFGQDTKDSGGIVVDGGSARTRILRNTVRYGGDGIFVRAITGRCPTETWVEGNDVSYSPHFAMETWCDGDTYVGNTSLDSDNGFWLGGGSNIRVANNHIERSRVYAMSIMENQGRHIVVEDNVFAHNRAGIMITGKNRWPGQPLDSAGWPNMANSSQIVVQRNVFNGNDLADLAASFTRSLVVASNCTNGATLALDGARFAAGPMTDAVKVVGACNGAAGATAPSVTVTAPAVVALGSTAHLAATSSAGSFTWLVQPANHRFPSGALPPAPFAQASLGAATDVVFDRPGLFDVDVTADDGRLAGIAHAQVAVPPQGRRVGETAAEWAFDCAGEPCNTHVSAEPGVDGPAVRLASDAPKRFAAVVPKTRDLGATAAKLAFFVRAKNPKPWQRTFPEIVVGGPNGRTTLPVPILDPARPSAGNVLKFGEEQWIYVEVPVTGTIDWIELHTETTPGDPIELSIDDVTLL